jgi:Ca2+-binding EF-hand superfamily protein
MVDAPRRSEQIHAESDALFKQLDKNNDGKLSRKEIKNGLHALKKDTGLKLQGNKANDIFSYLDDDGGGEVRPDS